MNFLSKRGIFNHLFQKILILVIILIMAFLISRGVFAQSYTTDFEDFNLGTIYGQEGGTWDCAPSGNCAQIVTTTVHSGEKSLYSCYNCPGFPIKARKTGLDPRPTGRITFWAYPLSNIANNLKLNTDEDLADTVGEVRFKLENTLLKIRTGVMTWVTLATGVDLNEWNEIQIEWNVSTQLVRGKVDLSEWSAWTDGNWNGNFGNIVNFGLRADTINSEAYFDDFKYGEEWAIMPIIEPEYPEVGTTTEIDIGDFYITGSYWYDPVDPTTWLDFSVSFESATESYFFWRDISASSSAEYTIPVLIPEDGTYNVTYRFWGEIWTEECLFLPCYSQMVIYNADLATTTIIVGESGLPEWVEIPYIEFYDEEEPEAGTIQHFLWSIKNFFKNLILPTREAQSLLLEKIKIIKEKFPYNYISEIKGFMASTSEDVENDPTIELTFFNATGTATMGLSNADITLGSETKTFYEWIKIIGSMLLLAGFVAYTISFIRRIL